MKKKTSARFSWSVFLQCAWNIMQWFNLFSVVLFPFLMRFIPDDNHILVSLALGTAKRDFANLSNPDINSFCQLFLMESCKNFDCLTNGNIIGVYHSRKQTQCNSSSLQSKVVGLPNRNQSRTYHQVHWSSRHSYLHKMILQIHFGSFCRVESQVAATDQWFHR